MRDRGLKLGNARKIGNTIWKNRDYNSFPRVIELGNIRKNKIVAKLTTKSLIPKVVNIICTFTCNHWYVCLDISEYMLQDRVSRSGL